MRIAILAAVALAGLSIYLVGQDGSKTPPLNVPGSIIGVGGRDGKGVVQKTLETMSGSPISKERSGIPACNTHEIKIPPAAGKAIKKWDKDFVIWKPTEYSPLMCVKVATSPALALNAARGDFNGDGKTDIVIAGHNKTNEFLLAALSQNASDYQVVPLCSSEVGPSQILKKASGCDLLGVAGEDFWGLKTSPRLALFKVLPAGTSVEALSGAARLAFNLESEAFIVGHVDDKYISEGGAYRDRHGGTITDPFDAFRLGWWNSRSGREDGPQWRRIYSSKFDFLFWHILSIDGNSRDYSFSLKW